MLTLNSFVPIEYNHLPKLFFFAQNLCFFQSYIQRKDIEFWVNLSMLLLQNERLQKKYRHTVSTHLTFFMYKSRKNCHGVTVGK